MWFGKYEDDEPESKPKEDDFSMTSNWVHFDDDDSTTEKESIER
jgi:hypothetical protein